MGLDHRGIVSVVEIIVYIPCLLVAAYLCFRHGFGKSSGWVYTLILCLVRTIGSICQLAAVSNPSTGLIQAVYILDSIGISPLLLATLGLLSRLVDWINADRHPTFRAVHFRVLQLLITVGLILAIAGGTSSKPNSDGTISVSSTSKVGIILYIVAYFGIGLVLVISFFSLSHAPKAERLIAPAVALAMPIIAVRLLYSILSVFTHIKTFSRIDGSVAVLVCMSILEEFAVVGIYLLLGLRLEKLDPTRRGEISSRQTGRKARKNGNGHSMDNRRGPPGQQYV